ncbi:hypothetical protein [Thiohalobacter thiocyanaticus]|uniref:Uncharacterized protein n=1 Tax=Thiohalobacter thiocyanaticus TaxID=585455 RepID=A0A426QG30_9GAMM|nr:hypothetical protein [Thiohalobacter thiocyanaticus]RRQ20704.1 hypothetical protein D6C00_01025 [Thiohalobacter thiocyanaticus]
MADIVDLNSRRPTQYVLFWSASIARGGRMYSLCVARQCDEATPEEIIAEVMEADGIRLRADDGGFFVIPWPCALVEVLTSEKPIKNGWHQLSLPD